MARNHVVPSRNSVQSEKQAAWDRVARQVVKRRIELGLTQKEIAEAADTGWSFWNYIENGKKWSYAMRSIVKAENALGWPPRTIERILADKDFEPEVEDRHDDPDDVDDLRDQVESLAEEFRELKFLVKQQSEQIQPFLWLLSQLSNTSSPRQ